MSLPIKFPPMLDVPTRAPLFVAPPPVWHTEVVADLVSRARIQAEVADRGPWLVAQDERASLEVYLATHSLRYGVTQPDGEPQHAEPINSEKARSIADDWVAQFGPADARFDVRSITESELLVSKAPDTEPERFVTAVQVNYAFTLGELPVIGPGGKMQVAVDAHGEITGAYRFWREAHERGTVRVMSAAQAAERFAQTELFSALSEDTAQAEVTQIRLGYFALPPTEPQSVLLPVFEFRGVLSTELHPRHEFIRYVPAAAVKPVDVKNLSRPVPPRR